jgi:hypothetical protein
MSEEEKERAAWMRAMTMVIEGIKPGRTQEYVKASFRALIMARNAIIREEKKAS